MGDWEPRPGNRGLLLDMAVRELCSPGILVDEDVAARTPCRCYTYRGIPKICFSKGIIGSMSREQIEAYCNPLIVVGGSSHVGAFVEAAEEAHRDVEDIPRGERLEPWLHAMSRALKKRGIEI